LAPSPIATIAITAPTPMMMPSTVRKRAHLVAHRRAEAIAMVKQVH
jgi:hypothetical protein